MFKSADWECTQCGNVKWALIDVPSGKRLPKHKRMNCQICNAPMRHDKLMSAPAEYMGEKNNSPRINGGSFDTMGNAPVTPLPEIRNGECESKACWHDWNKRNKDQLAQRKEDKRRNQEKRTRAQAMASGQQINFKRDKCVGDPKL